MGGRPSSPASQSPNARKIDAYCRRVLADAARPAIRSGLPEQVPLLHPRRRRRRDHHDVGELVGDRAVDELELHRRLDGGEGELLLAHRPGLFVKPRISGHVKPLPGRLRSGVARHEVGSGNDTGLSPPALGSAPLFQHGTPPDIAEITAWGRVARVRKTELCRAARAKARGCRRSTWVTCPRGGGEGRRGPVSPSSATSTTSRTGSTYRVSDEAHRRSR